MKSRSDKIQKRRKKKTKNEQRSRDFKQQLERRKAFPEVIYRNENSPRELVDEVRSVVDRLPTSNILPDALRKSLRQLAEGKLRCPDGNVRSRLGIQLGDIVYSQLSRSFQTIYRMAHDIEFQVGAKFPRKISIVFRSLEEVRSRVFCSPKRYKVIVNENEYIAAFRDHALQRIGERTVLDPDAYACRGQAFAIPNRCKFFEVVRLPNGQPAAKIWNWCDPSTFLGRFHAELLGPTATARQKNGWPYFEIGGSLCYYLVGYCPIKFHDDLPEFAVLDSLWSPGMDHTPEFAAFVRDRKPDTVSRMNFGKRVSRTEYADLYKFKDFDLIREIHAYVPQVKAIPEEVFDYFDGSV